MKAVVIDPVVFGEISELMGESLPSFIETYLNNSPKLLAKIDEAVSAAEIDAVFHSAHQLKGGSGSIGAMQVAELANAIEAIARTGQDNGTLSSLFEELKKVYALTEIELKQHV